MSALPNTLKARTAEELKAAVIIPITPLVEPTDQPGEITFPWATNAFNLSTRIQIFEADFDVVQRWDPWYVGLGFLGCIGTCLLSPFVNKMQALNHRKSDILKVVWSEFVPKQSPLLVYPKGKPQETCRLYVKTNFDPNTVAPTQGERTLKYVFVVETGSDADKKLHELLG